MSPVPITNPAAGHASRTPCSFQAGRLLRRMLALVVLTALVAGCSLRPEYSRPAAPVPASLPAGAAYGEAGTARAAALPWQEFFSDPRLKGLIQLALQQNRDLKLATLNTERAQALYGIQRASLLPSVNAQGSYSKSRTPGSVSLSGTPYTLERYDVSLGISAWEIDFFGRLRDLKDQALEEFLATDQARQSAQILLIGSVANTYLALAADRSGLKLARATLETLTDYYRLIQRRQDIGLASELDLRRVQSQVEAARGEVARSQQLVALDEDALQLLVGAGLPRELLPDDLEAVLPLREVAPGLSSEVLLGRPDVRAAEHRLIGAHANIGAARKAFLPRISLTTGLGTASGELSGLFRSGSEAWNFVPAVTLPIFDARTWSAYDVAKVDREITLAQYEKAIQTAFREVADALAVRGTVEEQIRAQQALVAAVEETYRLSQSRYAKGMDSYLSVLDAQRSLIAAQQGLIALRLAALANRVTLYKVLGGGA